MSHLTRTRMRWSFLFKRLPSVWSQKHSTTVSRRRDDRDRNRTGSSGPGHRSSGPAANNWFESIRGQCTRASERSNVRKTLSAHSGGSPERTSRARRRNRDFNRGNVPPGLAFPGTARPDGFRDLAGVWLSLGSVPTKVAAWFGPSEAKRVT